MARTMADPEQSDEAFEPQWVGPPRTGDSDCVDLEGVRGDSLASQGAGRSGYNLEVTDCQAETKAQLWLVLHRSWLAPD